MKYTEDCSRNGARVLVDANTGKTPYNCVICDLGFFQRSKLYEHKRTTHGGNVSCPKCNNVLSSLRVLKCYMKKLRIQRTSKMFINHINVLCVEKDSRIRVHSENTT
jgi:hypothetical protein